MNNFFLWKVDKTNNFPILKFLYLAKVFLKGKPKNYQEMKILTFFLIFIFTFKAF